MNFMFVEDVGDLSLEREMESRSVEHWNYNAAVLAVGSSRVL